MSSDQSRFFPVGVVVTKAYGALYRHFGYALRICWAWIIVMTSARVAADLVKTYMLVDQAGRPLLGFDLTFLVGWFLFIPLASIAVAWHRLLLLDEQDPSALYMRLDRLVWSYFGMAVFIYVVSLAPVFVPWGLAQIVKATAGLGAEGSPEQQPVWIYLLSPRGNPLIPFLQTIAIMVFLGLSARLGIVLPAKALARAGFTLKRVWEATRGHSWGLLMGMIFCIAPFFLVTAFLRRLGLHFSLADGPLLHIADWLATETMGTVLGLVEVAYLTHCFLFFFPGTGEAPPEQG